MLLRSPLSALLCMVSTFLTLIIATPTIGIARDYVVQFAPGDPKGIHSYSGVIEFDDASIPGDTTKMSDAQFVNLAMIAYNEMVAAWKTAQLATSFCPLAMVALESEGFMYFASSVRGGSNLNLNALDIETPESVGAFMYECYKSNSETHRNGGGCGEPNLLRLYGDLHPPTGNPLTYQSPPTTNTSPRLAAIVRTRGLPNTNPNPNVRNIAPCANTAGNGYGCEKLVEKYDLKAIQDVQPDTDGQDDWNFKIVPNPRSQSCQAPIGPDGNSG